MNRNEWNPKVHYPENIKPPLALIVSQINPVHTFPTDLFTIHNDTIYYCWMADFVQYVTETF